MNLLNAGNYYYITGGSDSYMFGLEDLMSSAGHTVIPFAPKDENNHPSEWSSYFPDCINSNEAGFSDFPRYLYNPDAKKKLNRLLEHTDIDLAHLHIYYGRLTGAIFEPLQQHGIPVVQSLHEYKLACPVYTMISNGVVCEACQGHKFWKAIPGKCKQGSLSRTLASVTESYLTRWLGAVDKIDHFIAVSDFMRNKMLEYDIGKGKISTVHNFVNPDEFLPSTTDGEYFFYFGRLERVKGLFTLIEASSKLPEVPLIIAGTGDAGPEINGMIKEQNLDHIKMVGFQSGKNLEKLIRESVCTLMPSEWYENCPMSVIESLAYARPVIGSKIGGIPELIEDKEDGFLFEPGSSEQLLDKMKWMASNKKKAAIMGRSGRKKVERKFNKDEHYKKLMDIYKQL